MNKEEYDKKVRNDFDVIPDWEIDWQKYYARRHFGRLHFTPFFDNRADYNTNAKSYYDYLALRVQLLNEVIKQCNNLLRRDIKFNDSTSIKFEKTNDWQKQQDVIYITATLLSSKKELNAIQILSDGVYVKDLSPDINQLKDEINDLAVELEGISLTTNTPNYLKITKKLTGSSLGFNIDFSSNFLSLLEPLLVYKNLSTLDFKYLPMTSPSVGTMQWATAYTSSNFSCYRQGRTITLNAYVKTTKIAPDVKEYLFVDLVQDWAKPIHQVSYNASWSNASVTEDVPVHGYLRTDGIMNVTTGSYREEFNGGYLIFQMNYQGHDL